MHEVSAMLQNNKAFSLMELLVVVVLAGILSTIVLPKFTNMLDSLRLIEAEQMLQAVRNEQEQRCMLDKKYTVEADKISAIGQGNTQNNTYTSSYFLYELNSYHNYGGKAYMGATATDLKSNVKLEIPSYLDGRICCNNCQYINRDYPTCAALVALPDYRPVTSDCRPE